MRNTIKNKNTKYSKKKGGTKKQKSKYSKLLRPTSKYSNVGKDLIPYTSVANPRPRFQSHVKQKTKRRKPATPEMVFRGKPMPRSNKNIVSLFKKKIKSRELTDEDLLDYDDPRLEKLMTDDDINYQELSEIKNSDKL